MAGETSSQRPAQPQCAVMLLWISRPCRRVAISIASSQPVSSWRSTSAAGMISHTEVSEKNRGCSRAPLRMVISLALWW